ncbi:hypothetical protein [Pseudophaeobacter sp.]|uniref:hypothetical protein n=1 Tax=Pseudophaeobacter sp. TaxID=1971739 RepID=UPI0032986436
MSYFIEIISHSHNDPEAQRTLVSFVNARTGYKRVGRHDQYDFETAKDEIMLLEFANETDEFDEEVEGDPRTVAWASINFFRSRRHYQLVARELQTILQTGAFFLYDPQSEVAIMHDFPTANFIAGMTDFSLEEIESFLTENNF